MIRPFCLFACLLLAIAVPLPAQEPPGADADPTATLEAAELLRFANGLFERAKRQPDLYERAAAQYEKFVTRYPDHELAAEAHLSWAACYTGRQPDRVLDIYRRLREKYPRAEAARRVVSTMAPMLIERDRLDEARQVLYAVDPQAGKESWTEAIHYFRGLVDHRQDRLPEAAANFGRLAAKPVNAALPHRAYAKLYLAFLNRKQDPDAAAKLFGELAAAADAPAALREEALFHLGQLAFDRQQWQAAAERFGDLVQRFPDSAFSPRARLRRAWALHQLEEHAKVLQTLEDGAGDDDQRLYLLGSSRFALKQYEAAAEAFAQLVGKHPRSSFADSAWSGLLQGLYHAGKYEACAEQATAVIAREGASEPVLQQAHLLLAQCHIARKQWAPAAEVLENALKKFPEKWDRQQAALDELARVYGEAGDHEKAARTYRRLFPLLAARERVTVVLRAAEHEMRAGNLGRAFQDYQLARQHAAEYPDLAATALLGMIESKVRQDEYAVAKPLLDEFVKNFPEHRFLSRVHYLRGTILYSEGQNEAAIADLDKAIADPRLDERQSAMLILGSAYWEKGDADAALRTFAKVLEDPAAGSRLGPQILNAIGERYVQRNELEAASQAYGILAKHQDYTVRMLGLLGLGKVAFARENYQEAAERFAKVKDQATKPEDGEFRAIALAYQGACYRHLGDLDLARVALEEAARLRMDDVRASALARYNLAHIYFQQGNLKKAKPFAQFAYVLDSDPVYSPKAMLLTIRIALAEEDVTGALATYRELQREYGIAAATYRKDPEHKDLFDRLEALAAKEE